MYGRVQRFEFLHEMVSQTDLFMGNDYENTLCLFLKLQKHPHLFLGPMLLIFVAVQTRHGLLIEEVIPISETHNTTVQLVGVKSDWEVSKKV